MKIIIVTNRLGGYSGWEKYSQALLTGLQKRGVEVVVFCQEVNKDFGVVQYPLLPEPMDYRSNYFLFWWTAIKLWRIARKVKADRIHCFVETYSPAASLLSQWLSKSYLLTIHGSYGIKMFSNFWYRFIQIRSYKKAKTIVCVSKYTQRRMMEHVALNNISVIPNGVDLPNDVPEHQPEPHSLVSVGILKKRKGLDRTINALPKIKEQFGDITYRIIGDQSDQIYFSYLKSLMKERNLEGNITFYQNITDQERDDIYLKSRLFILTPVSGQWDFEGFGLVYLEANARGIPVIGALNSGAEEAIRDGYNGFLVNPDDTDQIAEKALEILQDQVLYQKLSANALLWAQNFSWSKIIDKYLALY